MVLALDCYGTMLSCCDPENLLPARKGLLAVLKQCEEDHRPVCTISDGPTRRVQGDLQDCGIPLHYFDEFFEMQQRQPKHYRRVWEHYGVPAYHVLVVGDSWSLDIEPAMRQHCLWLHVPAYHRENTFDLYESLRSQLRPHQ